jgi:ribosomal protein S18 acetylase RimI-like enzyme
MAQRCFKLNKSLNILNMCDFKKDEVFIVIDESIKLILRSAKNHDIENLRNWKNEQKNFFFHQEEIDSEMQIKWFVAYQSRTFDIMTILELDGIPFGCMAIRYKEINWDIYNVILGVKEYGGKGYMGKAFEKLLDLGYGLKQIPITLQVLKHNPAVSWYIKQGFEIKNTHDSFYSMSHKNVNKK